MELKKYRLGEICEIYGRIGFRGYTTMDLAENENDGAITLSPSNIENGEISFARNTYLKWNKFYESPEIILEKGDVVLVKTGSSIGKTALVRDIPHPITLNPQFVVLKKIKTDSIYLSYVLKGEFFQKSLHAITVGSTIPTLSQENLSNISIFLPSIENQRRIASVLSSLDNKIALNRRINAKLEQIAKRLYDYWFVQFDFPDKNGKPYKSSGGKMVWNEVLKREVPEGWEVLDINKLCQIIDCLHSKKPDYCYEDENSYLLSLENITKEGYIDLSNKYYISRKDFKEWTSRICVKENDFLFTNAGRAGDMGMVSEGISCAIGRNITAVRPKNISPWYLRCFFKSLYMQEQILNNLDKGSFFMSFNVRSIKKLQVLIPNESIMRKFVAFIEPHIKRIEKNNKEISRLTALRDKLLPLLMNGQVEVKG